MSGEGRSLPAGGAWEVFGAFLRLGLTSFGGPIAHLGYFRTEFVERRRWLDDAAYADLVALCQFLPGPGSSQVGFALGLRRGGPVGALAAWAGFTLPSAALLTLFAFGIGQLDAGAAAGGLHGLKVAAVAVVAQAVLAMGRTLAPDRARATLAIAAATLALARPGIDGQVGALILGAAAGLLLKLDGQPPPRAPEPIVGRGRALACLAMALAPLAALPILAAASGSHAVALADAFYRAGALVFGGGHVVLPLLRAEVVPPGWISEGSFLAGYGAAQAMPGPLFTFAAYLGAAMQPGPNGIAGALVCLVALFAPGLLLVAGALPFWQALRRRAGAGAALAGVNAVVVGLLLAALYDPVWTAGITGAADFVLAASALLLLTHWRAPPWLVIGWCAIAGQVIAGQITAGA